jgi:hypothetical protein
MSKHRNCLREEAIFTSVLEHKAWIDAVAFTGANGNITPVNHNRLIDNVEDYSCNSLLDEATDYSALAMRLMQGHKARFTIFVRIFKLALFCDRIMRERG